MAEEESNHAMSDPEKEQDANIIPENAEMQNKDIASVNPEVEIHSESVNAIPQPESMEGVDINTEPEPVANGVQAIESNDARVHSTNATDGKQNEGVYHEDSRNIDPESNEIIQTNELNEIHEETVNTTLSIPDRVLGDGTQTPDDVAVADQPTVETLDKTDISPNITEAEEDGSEGEIKAVLKPAADALDSNFMENMKHISSLYQEPDEAILTTADKIDIVHPDLLENYDGMETPAAPQVQQSEESSSTPTAEIVKENIGADTAALVSRGMSDEEEDKKWIDMMYNMADPNKIVEDNLELGRQELGQADKLRKIADGRDDIKVEESTVEIKYKETSPQTSTAIISVDSLEVRNEFDEIVPINSDSSLKSKLIPATSSQELAPGDQLPSPISQIPTTALSPIWSFGVNRHMPLLNLSTNTRNLILYSNAHLGILYDFSTNIQLVLQGHANTITCTACSADKRWIVTGDSGPDSMVIIWDSTTAIPVRTMFEPHPGGVVSVDLSPDARYLATLSSGEDHQIVAVWDWTTGDERPLVSAAMEPKYVGQTKIVFNQSDSYHLASNSETQTIFFCWKSNKLEYFAPPLTDKDFNKPVGKFTQSAFLLNSTKALTATTQGLVVVWDSNKPLIKVFHYNPATERTTIAFEVSNESTPNKKAVKLVPLHEKAIMVLVMLEKYIVTGDSAGQIKFHDHNLMLIFWYQHLNFGSINSVSFRYIPPAVRASRPVSRRTLTPASIQQRDLSIYPTDATIHANKFVADDFVLGTNNALFASVTVAGNVVKILLRDHDAAVYALDAHPSQHRIATAGLTGLLKIWDYSIRQTIVSRYFEKGLQISCVAFDPNGIYLAVGFMNGSVAILDAETLQDTMKPHFHYARDRITHVVFSTDSQWMATVDAEFTTTLFERKQATISTPWGYVGRHKAHYKEIHDIMFGIHIDTKKPRLMSIGADRVLVEYDLEEACKDNLPILSSTKIEQSTIPLCMSWYPGPIKEQFICTSNAEFKLKLYNATTAMCRKTVLGPTFGSPIRKMLPIPNPNGASKYMVFHIDDQIGLIQLPIDGNPHKATTMMAHPAGVSNLACSFDGTFVFTAGGIDSTVHCWKVAEQVLEAQIQLGGEGIVPFYDLLEGGREGELFAQMEDYFYYAQLRSQGINTMNTRAVSTCIPVAEIPFVMRALGFYPTEQEIEDMLNEVKFSDFVETGDYQMEVDLESFIRLYVNHRPPFGLSLEKIKWAFDILGQRTRKGSDKTILREDFFDLLQTKGEHMMEYELAEYLTTLLGFNAEGGSCELEEFDPSNAGDILEEHIPVEITADQLVEDILCLVPKAPPSIDENTNSIVEDATPIKKTSSVIKSTQMSP